jgi:hypothetical protein
MSIAVTLAAELPLGLLNCIYMSIFLLPRLEYLRKRSSPDAPKILELLRERKYVAEAC